MKKLFLLFLTVLMVGLSASAQTRVVTGTVYDDTNEGLPGASVTAGKGYAASTDVDGNFSIRVPQGTTELTFSYVGYADQTVKIPASGKVTVYLQPKAEMLNEVITVAYGEQKRSAFTGSAAVVGAAQIEKVQSSNVLDALSGKVAGLQLSNASGSPDAGNPVIRVRGFSSINAGNAPLIIVDGATYTGDISNLNNNDIESITVQKDAASNALYGARGANGVIMITTKKAHLGDANVTVEAKWGANTRAAQDYDYITDPGQYYETYYQALYQYARGSNQKIYDEEGTLLVDKTIGGLGMTDAMANQWANANMINSTTYGLGYNVFTLPAGQMLIGSNGKLNPNATLGRLAVNRNGEEFWLSPDNWLDEAYKSSLRQEYNLSISQGTEKSNFYASLSYLDNQGIITAPSDFRRFTGRLSADVQAKSWLKFGANMSYTHRSSNNMSSDEGASNSTGNIFAAAQEIAPIYPLYMRDGNGKIMVDENGLLRYDYGAGLNAGLTRPIFGNSNALDAARLDTNKSNGNVFNVIGFAEIRFLKDFRFTSHNTIYINENRGSAVTNPFYGSYADMNGIVSVGHTRTYNQTYQQLLNWSHIFAEKHNVSALIGHEYYKNTGYSLSANKNNMFDPYIAELNNAIIEGSSSSYKTEYNVEGWFLRALYDYDGKYFGNFSFRRDASSKFHPKHRWGNFWSVGAAWILSKESFMQDIRWIDILKVKASYGEQGNDGIGNYLYTNTYDLVNSNGQPAAVPATLGNEHITWEKNGNFNAGIEFSVLNGRVAGTMDGFWRKTTDMLSYYPLPQSFGFSGYYANVGDMVNTGFELELNTIPVQTRDFTWSLGLNLTFAHNTIVRLPEERLTATGYWDFSGDEIGKNYKGYSSGNYLYEQGRSLYTFYGKKYAGVDPDSGKALYYKIVRDENGDPVMQNGRPQVTKTSQFGNADSFDLGGCVAPVYGGVSTTFEFKGFDLTANFNYQIGGQVYDSNYARLMGSPYSAAGKGDNLHADILKAWTPENNTSDIPRFFFGDENNNSTSSRFLTNASYFSCENINFGYTLPQNIVRKLYLTKLRVHFACDNVWVWSKRQGLDPRQSFTGGNNNTYYSPIRAISGGITVNF